MTLTNENGAPGGAINGGAGAFVGSGTGGRGGSGVSQSTGSLTVDNGGSIAGGLGGGGPSGAVGGSGVALSGSDLVNESTGTVTGGNGGGANAGVAGAGGAGAVLSGGALTNGGLIQGGAGAHGITAGGAGGSGVEQSAGALTNSVGATIAGGAAGGGETGGVGGAGAQLTSGVSTSRNGGAITGGAGGVANSNDGGAGGAGLVLSSSDLVNTGTITGGVGNYSPTKTGGRGGSGAELTGGTLTNDGGTIAGGKGGFGDTTAGSGSTGGAGGVGAALSGGTLLNGSGGSIMGGNGSGGDAARGRGGAGVVATGGGSITTAGVISGGLSADTTPIQANAVELSGGGNTLTLENGYSFTGNVVSTSGTANGGDTLALGGSANGTFDVSAIVPTAPAPGPAAPTVYSGFSQYAKTGTSTRTLTGSTGAVTPWAINAGTLSVSDDANLGAAGGGLTFNGGTLQNTAAMSTARNIDLAGSGTLQTDASLTASGVISGAGALTKMGAGTLTLTGDNTYTGGTTIAAGTLQVGNGGTTGTLGTGNVTDNGALVFNRSDSVAYGGAVSGTGSVTQQGPGTLTLTGANSYTGGTTINAGTLQVGNGGSITGNVANNSILAFDSSSAITYGGAITGAGQVEQNGSGLLALNGNSGAFTGTTTINAGTLMVGDASHAGAVLGGNVDVNTAGTLRGHGTVGGNVVNNGTVWPGGSIGVLSIGGNYTQLPAGTLKIDVSPTQASQLSVGGSANLAGNLDVLYGPGTYSTTSYKIVSAGQVNGTFGQVTGNTPAGVTQGVSYDPKAVNLNLTATPTTPVVINPTNATIFGDMGSAVLRAGQRANAVLLDRLGGVCTSASDTACVDTGKRLWMLAQGTQTRVSGNNGAPDVHDDSYGVMAGADRQYGDWTVGLAGGYSHSDLSETTGAAFGKIDTLRAAAYGGRALGPVYLSGIGSYAYNFTSTRRGFGAFGDTTADGGANELTAGLQASVPLHWGAFSVSPRAGVRYAYVHGLSATESGPTSQNLSVQDQTLRSLQPYVGATLDYAFNAGSSAEKSHLQLRAGYAYETQSMNRDVTVAASDGTTFVIPGTRDSRGMVTLGVGLEMPMSKSTRLWARYDALLPTGNVKVQSAQIGLTHKF